MFVTDKKKQKQCILLFEKLKKINKEFIELQESTCAISKFKQLKKYLCKVDIERLLLRARINLYERYRAKPKVNEQISKPLCCPNYFSKDRVVIYTAIYGSYDKVYEPIFIPDNCTFIIFTDLEIDSNSAWIKREYNDKDFSFLSNTEKNRFLKMHPHLLFSDYKYSVYIDGSIEIYSDLTEFIDLIGPYGVAFHNHSLRNCLYDELRANVVYGKITRKQANKYNSYLLKNGMPQGYGMLECGVIAREHHNPICIELMNEWWKMYKNTFRRDQLAIPLVLYHNHIVPNDIATLGNDIYHNYAFRINQHR